VPLSELPFAVQENLALTPLLGFEETFPSSSSPLAGMVAQPPGVGTGAGAGDNGSSLMVPDRPELDAGLLLAMQLQQEEDELARNVLRSPAPPQQPQPPRQAQAEPDLATGDERNLPPELSQEERDRQIALMYYYQDQQQQQQQAVASLHPRSVHPGPVSEGQESGAEQRQTRARPQSRPRRSRDQSKPSSSCVIC
jgi:hypothetical protein